MRNIPFFLVTSLILACETLEEDTTDKPGTSPTPGVEETCADADKVAFYQDLDEDGFGTNDSVKEACEAPIGYVAVDRDCDDNNAAINPDAEEICDGEDNNCDGTRDEDVKETFYADEDGDGYGNESDSLQSCEAPADYVDVAGDCDDTDAEANVSCIGQLRFINVDSESSGSYTLSVSMDGETAASRELYFTQGTERQDLDRGVYDLVVTNNLGVQVARTSIYIGPNLSYTVGVIPGGGVFYREDFYNDDSAIQSDEVRLNLLNLESGAATDIWIGEWNGQAYPVENVMTMAYGDTKTLDLPVAQAAVQLELLWEQNDGSELLVDWNIAAYLQLHPGTLVDIFFWNDGLCTFLSLQCTPYIIGIFENGETATVEGSFGWAG